MTPPPDQPAPEPAAASPEPAAASPGPEPAVPRWRRALRVVYLVVVLAAFTAAVVARREDLAQQLSGLAVVPMAWSCAAALAGVGVSGLVWRRMLTGLGSPLPAVPAGRVFFVAQLGKYLPGSLWPVLAQAELGGDLGVPKRSAVAAQTLFMWVHLVTGAVIGVPVLAAVGVLPTWTGALPVLAVPLLFPGPLTRVMDWLLRRLGRQPLPARPAGVDMAVACGWAVLMWVCYGLHVHLAVDAIEVTAPGVGEALVAIGVFAAAWSAGFVFLVAPAGAGARELVLVAGLGAVTASETAFTVALLSRLVLTAADGAWGLGGVLAGVGRRPAGRARSESSGVDARADRGPGDG